MLKMADALIVATALLQDELLCTSNAKHFLPIDGLKLEIYSPLHQ
jgi:predicted nucleic acid-binding protein